MTAPDHREWLRQVWRSVATAERLADAESLIEALIAAHEEPHRHYHTTAHVAFLLGQIEDRLHHIDDVSVLRLAAFFHDAVYDPLAKDNELRSADWARQDLVCRGFAADRADRLAALILKTAAHHAGDATVDEALFLDMDFSILGAAREVYEQYAKAIRAEYAAVPDDAFRKGRAAFLRNVLAQPRMFRTEFYETALGVTARANIAWEIARLEG